MQLKDGTLLQGGKYKIERHISSGGFGNTYEGVHSMMDTRIAIKEFFPNIQLRPHHQRIWVFYMQLGDDFVE